MTDENSIHRVESNVVAVRVWGNGTLITAFPTPPSTAEAGAAPGMDTTWHPQGGSGSSPGSGSGTGNPGSSSNPGSGGPLPTHVGTGTAGVVANTTMQYAAAGTIGGMLFGPPGAVLGGVVGALVGLILGTHLAEPA